MPASPDPHEPTPDGTDRLLLHEAADDLREAHAAHEGRESRERHDDVVVLDDRSGALVLGVLAGLEERAPESSGPTPVPAPRVRSAQDRVTSERSLQAALADAGACDRVTVHAGLGPDLLRDARVVLLRLPKSLDALEETAQAVARWAPDDVVVYAGAPVKHMTRTMNEVLLRSFGEVHATLGRHKARALVARRPLDAARTTEPTFPRTARLDELDLTVVAHGGVFAGTRLDIGTRTLLGVLDQAAPEARDAVDLGCGTGVLATVLARSRPGLRVVASDQSAAAVASTLATAGANGVGDRVTGLRDDALSTLPDASADLVVCNPPFHEGTTLETDAAHRMFAAAARVLRPGGELWTVYNSHLRHKSALGRVVGPTTMVLQNPKFTVTRSVRPDGA
ncbi:16S rRNA m(2)G 1207 methyltransferase [Sanguibacter keddieii DSM 10542]|uniref:16S rRNA m(2)G 1207 methyltransferase n=1 Tax=Sanguibacter keddieii (strain ATCC 51767 / DSM 10542 / NCFB 3025 / ST-74) TaxID=446469 RepID=D1BFL3_SANKS|nr:methyltransferase [Sanguibacter keddieii]ACZ23516.1 16S rRNA m(2)G 1207 methyltransferase [Sanguibacter keddieii DSM 10542]